MDVALLIFETQPALFQHHLAQARQAAHAVVVAGASCAVTPTDPQAGQLVATFEVTHQGKVGADDAE
ncbi:hypothetical protein D3C83_44300 [compost metagenome]